MTGHKTKPEIAAAKADFLSRGLRERIEISDADLTALGQQRAMAVQQALLTDTQVDPRARISVANDKQRWREAKSAWNYRLNE